MRSILIRQHNNFVAPPQTMSFGSRIISGLSWTAGGKFASQLVSWAITIYVIRILSPEDYGLLAMATVLISILSILSDLGLSQAAVSEPKVDAQTLRLVFGFALAVNGALYCILFVAAPFIASFYSETRLTLIIRIVGLQFLIGAFGIIPSIQLQRALEFKWRSIIGFTTAIASAVTTLACAIAGLGVWALILGNLVGAALSTIAVNILSPFPHLPSFILKGSKRLFSFGSQVVSARILGTIYGQADTAIGARVLGAEQIGLYAVGMQLASLPLQRVAAILMSVAFPAFARLQDQPEIAGRYLVRALRILCVFSFPIFLGIAVTAPEIVAIFLGSKWDAAVLPLQLLALTMPLRIVWQTMPPTLYGLGHANIVLQNHIVAFIAMIGAFLVGVQYGIVGLSMAWLLMFPIVFLVNFRTWLPAMHLNGAQFFGTMTKPLLASIGMAASVMVLRALSDGSGVTNLFALIAVGAISYGILIWILDRNTIRDIQSIVFRKG